MRTVSYDAPIKMEIGERFSMQLQVPDRRWWSRLMAWLLRKPTPSRTETRYFTVVGNLSALSVEIKEVSAR